jgi:hypothetical protein
MASRGLIDGACLLQDRRDYDRDPLNWVEAVALEAGLAKAEERARYLAGTPLALTRRPAQRGLVWRYNK